MNKKKSIIIGIILLILIIGSFSYAIWTVTNTQSGSNIYSTGCFDVVFKEETPAIDLENIYPISNEDSKKLIPYQFTLTNTCATDAKYELNLEVLEKSSLAYQYVNVSINNWAGKAVTDYDTSLATIPGASSYKLTEGSLAGASTKGAGDGGRVTYNLRLWLDEDAPTSQMSKDFFSSITVTSVSTTENIQTEVVSGKLSIDDRVSYTLYSDGKLYIGGSGPIKDYENKVDIENNIQMNIYSQIVSDYLRKNDLLDNISSYDELNKFVEVYSYLIAKESKVLGSLTLKEVYETYGYIEPSSIQYLDLKAEISEIPIITEIIMNDVTSIGNYAFSHSTIDIKLPMSVLSISNTAFNN